MINEKLILETLTNHTKRLADLQNVIASVIALSEAYLPGLLPEQKETLRKHVETLTNDSKLLRSGAERLQQAIQNPEMK